MHPNNESLPTPPLFGEVIIAAGEAIKEKYQADILAYKSQTDDKEHIVLDESYLFLFLFNGFPKEVSHPQGI